jgi:hypothetical protein
VRSVRRSMRRGSRAHVSRMVHRRKTLPSIATHLAVQVPGQRPVRIAHPAFAQMMKEGAGAHAVADAGEGGQR